MKSAKLYVYKGKFEKFVMKKDESIPDMFNLLNEIMNELKVLGLYAPNMDFSQKFPRSLLQKYNTIVTMLVRK